MNKTHVLAVLREGIEGCGGKLGYYLDDEGLSATLARTSAEQASRSIGGNSIAAHVRHILFSFDAFGAYIGGDGKRRDWTESWNVSTVDEEAWTKLQRDLAEAYAVLRDRIEAHGESTERAIGASFGAATHLAYHVGAIRQKLAVATAG